MHLTLEIELVAAGGGVGGGPGTMHRSVSAGSTCSQASDGSSGGGGTPAGGDGGDGSPALGGVGTSHVTPEVRTQDRSAKWAGEMRWELSRNLLQRGAALRIVVRDDFGMGPARVVGEALYPVDRTTMTLKPAQHQLQLKRQRQRQGGGGGGGGGGGHHQRQPSGGSQVGGGIASHIDAATAASPGSPVPHSGVPFIHWGWLVD